MVKISVKTTEPEFGVTLVEELISLLSNQQTQKLQVELQQIENLLKLHSIDLQTRKSHFDLLNRQYKESKVKIDSLEKARQDKISNAEGAVAVLVETYIVEDEELSLRPKLGGVGEVGRF